VSVIDRDLVRHVAHLARLRFEADEEERLLTEMARIVDYVDLLGELPDAGEDEPAPDDPHPTPLRDDAPAPWPRSDDLLRGAPDRDGDHLRVPAVIQDAT
jgi:aspartyl-tRNA(Asn)/glutamyl-tRNA(Gln) amidotransferase subunit C